MDLAKKYRVLIWVSLLLLVVNLVTLATIWFRPPIPPAITEPVRESRAKFQRGALVKELQLNTEQAEFYQTSRKKHFKEMRKLKHEIGRTKILIHEEIFSENPDTTKINQWIDSIGVLNIQFERNNYRHFLQPKTHLDEKQIDRFKQLMRESFDDPENNQRREHHRNENSKE
ncbi:MAG TPA: hypothetical protein DEQ03_12815 [Marinilabiliales bacterium]|nr:hypothetical protein [Marinilabiliales bacterium]